MKLHITDQFLWDIYREVEKIGDVAHFLIRPRHTMRDVAPDSNDPRNRRYLKKFSNQQFSKLIYNLKKNNYIRVKNLEGKKAIILTQKGIDKALKASFKIESQQKIKRIDGKWIMVIFDIPTEKEWKRGILRSILQNLGYKMFQKSVWITPYDVQEKTEEQVQFHNLDKYIRIFLIEEMT